MNIHNKGRASRLKKYAPALLSGVALVFAFPKYDYGLLAFVALVPLLVSLEGLRRSEAALAGLVFGSTYIFGTNYWIYHSLYYYGGVPLAGALLGILLGAAYLGVYYALVAYFFVRVRDTSNAPAALLVPVLWVMAEYGRSHLMTGVPLALVGYTQHQYPVMLQIADTTGIYGVSFLVVAVNGAIADVLTLKLKQERRPLFSLGPVVGGVAAVVALLCLSLGYGAWRLGQEPGAQGREVRVSVIQANIEQSLKWDTAFQQTVVAAYDRLTEEAMQDEPDLIVWPETAVPIMFEKGGPEYARMKKYSEAMGADLLFGAITSKPGPDGAMLQSNSTIFIGHDRAAAQVYDKLHLVPFGEYVPLRNVLFFIKKLTAGIGDFAPGTGHARMKAEYGEFAAVICYEIMFPGLVRNFYRDGGDFIVTVTNDGWFGTTSGPHQHFAMSVLRSVENRKPLVRAANTGISGFVDSHGRVTARTNLMQEAVLSGTIRTDSTRSFYSRFGDLFVYICMVVSIVAIFNTYKPGRR